MCVNVVRDCLWLDAAWHQIFRIRTSVLSRAGDRISCFCQSTAHGGIQQKCYNWQSFHLQNSRCAVQNRSLENRCLANLCGKCTYIQGFATKFVLCGQQLQFTPQTSTIKGTEYSNKLHTLSGCQFTCSRPFYTNGLQHQKCYNTAAFIVQM